MTLQIPIKTHCSNAITNLFDNAVGIRHVVSETHSTQSQIINHEKKGHAMACPYAIQSMQNIPKGLYVYPEFHPKQI